MNDVQARINQLLALGTSSFEEEGRTAARKAAQLAQEHGYVLAPKNQTSSGDLTKLQETVRRQDTTIRMLKSDLRDASEGKQHAYRQANQAQQIAREQSIVIGSLRDEIAEIAEAARIAKQQAQEIESLQNALEAARAALRMTNSTTRLSIGAAPSAEPEKTQLPATPSPAAPLQATPPAASPPAATPVVAAKPTPTAPPVVAPPVKAAIEPAPAKTKVGGLPSFDIPMPYHAPATHEPVPSISLDWTPPASTKTVQPEIIQLGAATPAPPTPVVKAAIPTPPTPPVAKAVAPTPPAPPVVKAVAPPPVTSPAPQPAKPKKVKAKAPVPQEDEGATHLAKLAANLLFNS